MRNGERETGNGEQGSTNLKMGDEERGTGRGRGTGNKESGVGKGEEGTRNQATWNREK